MANCKREGDKVTGRLGEKGTFSRRDLLIGGGALVGTSLLFPTAGWAKSDALNFADDPFSLGVASGEPWANSVVLWTRLAPKPLEGGGMPKKNVPVKWEIASDEQMQKVVAKGTAIAAPEFGHSVHVVVERETAQITS